MRVAESCYSESWCEQHSWHEGVLTPFFHYTLLGLLYMRKMSIFGTVTICMNDSFQILSLLLINLAFKEYCIILFGVLCNFCV